MVCLQLGLDSLEQALLVKPQQPGDVEHLHKIDPSFAAFVLRHERLIPAQPLRQFMLG